MIKTNRISRIFNEKLLQKGRSSCLGNRWQIVWLVCLLTIEIVACFGWVYGTSGSPSPREVYSKNSKDASLVCDFSGNKVGFSLWLIYNAGLIVVCTYQAFLVRKVPQNYNESKFIAFSMTTICITVLVFAPSYMGTSGWYRAVISCFMFIFLGSVTWASIFIPKIYIIFFRPHKNVPMRPSVSSITLGVILPSPSVVSSTSDPSRRSRSNSLSADNDCNDTWDNFNLKSRDEGTENEACTAEAGERFACETTSEHFGGEQSSETPENKRHYSSEKEFQDESNMPREIHERRESKEKKQSVVHFEDDAFVDEVSRVSKPVLVGKHSDTQGILRRKLFHFDDDTAVDCGMEAVSASAGQERKKSSLKRKTSSVRFQDQVENESTHQKQDHCGLALKDSADKEEFHTRNQAMQLSLIDGRYEETGRSEEAGYEGADDSSDAKEAANGHVNSSGVTNKRKMSVWCFNQGNEQQQVVQNHILENSL